MKRRDAHQALYKNKIIPVISTECLQNEEEVLSLASALHEGGCNVIEFLLRAENAADIVTKEIFDQIHSAFPDMIIGAGTCVTPHDIQRVKDAGGDFCVSASLSWECAEKADELDMFYIPGVSSLSRFHQLVTGTEVSPYSRKTIHELLGGSDIATLKVHPGGATWRVDRINSTIMNGYQKQMNKYPFVGLEPSEGVENDWTIERIGEFSKKDNVTMMGGSFVYVEPRLMGGYRDLIREEDWKGITHLANRAMAVTHNQPDPERVSITTKRTICKTAGALAVVGIGLFALKKMSGVAESSEYLNHFSSGLK